MESHDLDEDKYITEQLEALDTERDAIQEQYDDGAISEKEYKSLMSKNSFTVAQIKERNQESMDREAGEHYERKHDLFSD